MEAISQDEAVAYSEERKPSCSRKAIACKVRKSPSVKREMMSPIWAVRS